MFSNLKKRRKTPSQPLQEVTIPLDAVCGGSVSANPYPMPEDPTKPQVDPIQVGPTG
jgi:hypothetical protein